MPKIVKKYGKITLILGLILVLVAIYLTIPTSRAGYTTKEKDVLSDSRPSTLADHTIYFVTPTGVDASTDTITVTFPTGWGMGTFALLNFDLAVDTTAPIDDCASFATEKTLATTPAAGVWGVGQSGQVVTFTAPTNAASGEIAAGSCVQIEIGSNATAGGAGATQLTNHATPASYAIDIAGAFGDTGRAMVAVISGVTVSVTVAESLSVTVNAVDSATCTTTGGTKVTTTATTVPFATVNTEAFYDGCQRVDVGTNAANGYGATVQKTQLLTCSSYTIADGSCDGTCSTTTAAAWATATNNGFGYCMDDVAGDAAGTADTNWGTYYCGAATQYFKLIGTGAANAKTIMSSAGPVSGDQSYIGYRLSVDAAQTACTPYETVISYVVTPTY
jgi:hypothetical protein